MRKRVCLVSIGLLLVSVALLSCTPAKTVITKSNLSTLRGTWQGWTTFSSFQSNPILTTMEIINDTVPVKGKLTLENVPGAVTVLFPPDAVTAGRNINLYFRNGMVSDQGTLIGETGQNFLELTLYGEKKMDGWFYYGGSKGTMELTKK